MDWGSERLINALKVILPKAGVGGQLAFHVGPPQSLSFVTTLCQLPHESGLGVSGFFPPGRPRAASQRREHRHQPPKPRRTSWRPAEAGGSISGLKPIIEAPAALCPTEGRAGQGTSQACLGNGLVVGQVGATVRMVAVSWASTCVASNPCFLGDEKLSVAG